MAIAFVQSAINAVLANATATCSWPAATTLNNHLLLGISVRGGSGTTITTPATWTKIGEISNGTNEKVALYYIENAAVKSGAQNVSLSAAVDSVTWLAEFSGVATSGSLDQFGSNTNTSFNPDSGSITTTVAQELVVAATAALAGIGVLGLSQSTPTDGFTLQKDQSTAGTQILDLAFLYRIVSTTDTYDTTTTLSISCNNAGMIASFKQAGASDVSTQLYPLTGGRGAVGHERIFIEVIADHTFRLDLQISPDRGVSWYTAKSFSSAVGNDPTYGNRAEINQTAPSLYRVMMSAASGTLYKVDRRQYNYVQS